MFSGGSSSIIIRSVGGSGGQVPQVLLLVQYKNTAKEITASCLNIPQLPNHDLPKVYSFKNLFVIKVKHAPSLSFIKISEQDSYTIETFCQL